MDSTGCWLVVVSEGARAVGKIVAMDSHPLIVSIQVDDDARVEPSVSACCCRLVSHLMMEGEPYAPEHNSEGLLLVGIPDKRLSVLVEIAVSFVLLGGVSSKRPWHEMHSLVFTTDCPLSIEKGSEADATPLKVPLPNGDVQLEP